MLCDKTKGPCLTGQAGQIGPPRGESWLCEFELGSWIACRKDAAPLTQRTRGGGSPVKEWVTAPFPGDLRKGVCSTDVMGNHCSERVGLGSGTAERRMWPAGVPNDTVTLPFLSARLNLCQTSFSNLRDPAHFFLISPFGVGLVSKSSGGPLEQFDVGSFKTRELRVESRDAVNSTRPPTTSPRPPTSR